MACTTGLVSPDPSCEARIWRGGRNVTLGSFATAEEAALCIARSPAAAESQGTLPAVPPGTSLKEEGSVPPMPPSSFVKFEEEEGSADAKRQRKKRV